MAIPCLGFLIWLWDLVQTAVVGLLGSLVVDWLSYVWQECRDRFLYWWNKGKPVPVPADLTNLAGGVQIEAYLKDIRDYLNNDEIGIIGVYGMGGVGKTTLLQIIHNKFPEIGVRGFDVVIWVFVSQNARVPTIQRSIGNRLGMSLSADVESSSPGAKEQAIEIYNSLENRRFLLLLDDVWERLDLDELGIPRPTAENKSKIILTSRSRQVCRSIDANKLIKVEGLNEQEAWKLFKEKVGPVVDLEKPPFNQLSKTVAKKCGGLPLALITVGRAMAEARSVREWEKAVEDLKVTPHKVEGMEKEVLSCLRFSFERLRDENMKNCLLYCSLFPEDLEIKVEQLIEYWIGEGFLYTERFDSVIWARKEGEDVLTKLVSACMLEKLPATYKDNLYLDRGNVQIESGYYRVKMHDVVREMCLWLTGGDFDKGNIFLSYPLSPRMSPLSEYDLWRDTRRISCTVTWRRTQGFQPSEMPLCVNLQTLLCSRMWYLESIPQGLFVSMPALLVLDLSHTGLTSLPEEIGSLSELRFLDLSRTRLETLPQEMGRLTKLRQLILEKTWNLDVVPRQAIASLTSLRMLRLYETGHKLFRWSRTSKKERISHSSPRLRIFDMEQSLLDLEEISLTICTLESLQQLLGCERLRRSMTRLEIHILDPKYITVGHLSRVLLEFKSLTKLKIRDVEWLMKKSSLDQSRSVERMNISVCRSLSSSLRVLRLVSLNEIYDLTFIKELVCLEILFLHNCQDLQELIWEEERGHEASPHLDSSSLLNLRRMHLWGLPALKTVSHKPMLLPSLVIFEVSLCPLLNKLPFGAGSCEKIKVINGEREWWDGLNWEIDGQGKSLKCQFSQVFTPEN